MSSSDKYGKFYYCIKVTNDLTKAGEIYAYADEVKTNADGSLALWSSNPEKPAFVNLLIPAGKWLVVYAASVIDGSAISVEHWEGEVSR